MLISEKDAIEGARVLYPIGKIKAASTWHAVGYVPVSNNWRERVLQDLIRRAEDIDADAIIEVDYKVEPVENREEAALRSSASVPPESRYGSPTRLETVTKHDRRHSGATCRPGAP